MSPSCSPRFSSWSSGQRVSACSASFFESLLEHFAQQAVSCFYSLLSESSIPDIPFLQQILVALILMGCSDMRHRMTNFGSQQISRQFKWYRVLLHAPFLHQSNINETVFSCSGSNTSSYYLVAPGIRRAAVIVECELYYYCKVFFFSNTRKPTYGTLLSKIKSLSYQNTSGAIFTTRSYFNFYMTTCDILECA